MSLGTKTVWEVRPATGNDGNSGGFDNSVTSPGTDYSQQNAAQITYSDLVIGATNTQLTSAGNPFGSAHPGNVIQITGGTGFTAGFYTVVSVSGTTATMDRAVGTANSTGGTGTLGGALATLGKLFTNSASTTVPVHGNIVWMTGTLTLTAQQNFTFSNPSGDRYQIRGYGSSRGDGTNATITTSTNSIKLIALNAIEFLEFDNITFTSTAGTPGDGIHALTGNSQMVVLKNCILSGFAVGINGNFSVDYSINNLVLFNTEIKSCTAQGIINSGNTFLFGCYIHNNTSDGVQMISNQGSGITASGTVFANNGGTGFYDNATSTFRINSFTNCVFYNNTSDGAKLNSSGSCQSLISINNIFYNNGGYGQNMPSIASSAAVPSLYLSIDNAFGSNTSGARSSGMPTDSTDITLTANPFNNASGGDFSLNSTSGGGAACNAAGWQSSII